MKNFIIILFIASAFNVGCSDPDYIEAGITSVDGEQNVKLQDAGGFITAQKAHDELTRMLNYRNEEFARTGKDQGNYGYIFGINKIKQFVNNIENLNQSRPINDQIVGVRIYNILKQKEVNGALIEYKDVLLIPVLNNKEDIIDIHNLTGDHKMAGDDIILNISIPCPNNCD